MTTTTTKKALIRKPGYPIGQPAPMFIRCCDSEIDIPQPFDGEAEPVTCPHCGTCYAQTGWVVERDSRCTCHMPVPVNQPMPNYCPVHDGNYSSWLVSNNID